MEPKSSLIPLSYFFQDWVLLSTGSQNREYFDKWCFLDTALTAPHCFPRSGISPQRWARTLLWWDFDAVQTASQTRTATMYPGERDIWKSVQLHPLSFQNDLLNLQCHLEWLVYFLAFTQTSFCFLRMPFWVHACVSVSVCVLVRVSFTKFRDKRRTCTLKSLDFRVRNRSIIFDCKQTIL